MIAYKITNIANGKSYIGITARSLEHRFKSHIKASRRTVRSTVIANAMAKYGRESFKAEILYEASSARELMVVERALIAEHGTYWPLGYNMTSGGDGRPDALSDLASRLKLSAALKGRKKSPEHIERWKQSRLGWKPSAETIARNAASHRGRKQPPEAIAKTAAANRGRKHSAELIARRVATRKANGGWAHTEETKLKMRRAKRASRLLRQPELNLDLPHFDLNLR